MKELILLFDNINEKDFYTNIHSSFGLKKVNDTTYEFTNNNKTLILKGTLTQVYNFIEGYSRGYEVGYKVGYLTEQEIIENNED